MQGAIRKSAILFVTGVVSLGLHFFGTIVCAEERIKIGVSTALTGNAATYGIDLKNALLFANARIARNKYELVFEDDRCNGKDAVSVSQRFINLLKLSYVAGFACSSTVLSAAKNYERAKVLAMVMSASAAEISSAGDFIFRTWPSDQGAARTLFQYVASKQSHLAIVSEQTDYAQGFEKEFIRNNTRDQLKIVTESFLTTSTDFRSLLLRLRQKNPEGLFINSQSEATFLAVLKQVKELKWDVQIYGAYWAGSKSVLDQAKEYAQGIIFVDTPSIKDAVTAEGIKVFEDFEKQFGKMQSIELMFATAFEGFRALHQAIESGKDIRDYLYATQFHGLFGDWRFDANGEIIGLDFVMKVVRKDGVERL